MSRAILIILVALLAGGAYLLFRPHQRLEEMREQARVKTEINDGWRNYQPQNGKFSVQFPVDPHHASDTINDTYTQQLKRYEMYVAEGVDGTVYMINLISYPEGEAIGDKQEIFKNFINDMLTSNPRNQLISSSNTQFNGHDGMDFELKNDDVTITSKMFLDGNVLYVLSKVAKNTIKDSGEFEKFVNSFKLSSDTPSQQNTPKK